MQRVRFFPATRAGLVAAAWPINIGRIFQLIQINRHATRRGGARVRRAAWKERGEKERGRGACARGVATTADAFLNETVAVSSHQGVHPRFHFHGFRKLPAGPTASVTPPGINPSIGFHFSAATHQVLSHQFSIYAGCNSLPRSLGARFKAPSRLAPFQGSSIIVHAIQGNGCIYRGRMGSWENSLDFLSFLED